METSEREASPLDPAPDPGSEPGPDEPVSEVPSVVAVVVTSDPGERFDAALASLAAQDYPSLTVLVIDAGSREDPSPRIGAVLPDAFVRRLGGRVSFAAAANDALTAVEGANFLLFCRDDVVLEPEALWVMVEEALRSNAGVVGPKIVDAERREVLLQVGMSTDKFGVPYSGIEPGEIDHEQHDAVRDVLYVPDAALLVRADLCVEIGGFDPDLSLGLEALDLCWRARLAGARVVVAPDAVARRPAAGLVRLESDDVDLARALEPRQRLRILLRNYSAWSLVRVLPQAAVFTVVHAVALLVAGRGRRARHVLGAWWWNVRHLPSALRQRRMIQRRRVIADQEVRALQVRGSATVRAFLHGYLDLGERVARVGGTGRELAAGVSTGLRRPVVVLGSLFVLVVLAGSRDLLSNGPAAVGSLLGWPAVGDGARAFTSAWRFAGVGSPAPAPPALALMAGLSSVLLGAAGLARTLLIVAAIPAGAFTAYRLVRPLARTTWPPVAAAAIYAANPVPRNAIAHGRLGALVFYALLPALLERVLRAGGVEPFADPIFPGDPPRDRGRALLALGILLALVTAFFPAAPGLLLVATLALLLVSPLAGGDVGAFGEATAAALVAGVLAFVLLVPWSFDLLVPAPDRGALGLVFRPPVELGQLLRFQTGPARLGIGWLALVAAAHPLLVGSGARYRWAVRAWALAVAGWAMAWLPGLVGGTAVRIPAVEGVLAVSALGVAVAAGLGVGILQEEIRRHHLGWRQLVTVVATGALVLATLPFMADAVNGRWHLPTRDWARALRWMPSERDKGGFRVLWAGDVELLPLDPRALGDGTGWGLTRGGTGDATDLWPSRARGADRYVARALEDAMAGRTDRLGHALGTLAIRYVAVPLADAPGQVTEATGGPVRRQRRVPNPDTRLTRALSRQLDLARLSIDPGLLLFENKAWVPETALVTGAAAGSVVGPRSRAALEADVSPAVPLRGALGPDDQRSPERLAAEPAPAPPQPATVFFGDAYDRRWSASAGGTGLRHERAFGWANAFTGATSSRVSLHFRGQLARDGLLVAELAVWVVAVGSWRRRRALERPPRPVPAPEPEAAP